MSKDIKSKTVKVGDIDIHYLEKGKGPLVLMLHGFPEYSGTWSKYLDNLSDQYTVVAPDMRGYNRSSQPSEVDAYTIDKLMQDMTGLVEKLGYQKACLVGHDWGGVLSWYLAAHHPGSFSKVLIMNAPYPTIYAKLLKEDKQQKAMASYIPFFMNPGSETTIAAGNYAGLLLSYASSTHQLTPGEKEGLLNAWSPGLLGPINYYRAYIPQQEQLAAAMPPITIPTLLLWGEKDAALSIKNLDGLDTFVSQIKIERYPNATHWINYEEPDAISTQIRQFCGN